MEDEIIVQYNVEWSEDNYSLDKRYRKPGVWALWTENTEGKRICLKLHKR